MGPDHGPVHGAGRPRQPDGTSDGADTGFNHGLLATESEFALACLAPDDQNVTDPYPPLPFAVDIHVRRRRPEDSVTVTLDTWTSRSC